LTNKKRVFTKKIKQKRFTRHAFYFVLLTKQINMLYRVVYARSSANTPARMLDLPAWCSFPDELRTANLYPFLKSC